MCVREPLASEDGGGGEIHLGEGVSIQSFSLTHSFSAESFWIQMEGLYYTILLPQFSPDFERWYYNPPPLLVTTSLYVLYSFRHSWHMQGFAPGL